MSVLFWVQTVCKGYQLMTKFAAARKELNMGAPVLTLCMLGNQTLKILKKAFTMHHK